MKTHSMLAFVHYGAADFVAGMEHDVRERLPCKLTTANVELGLLTIQKLEVRMQNNTLILTVICMKAALCSLGMSEVLLEIQSKAMHI